jgi:glyoxalase family protein
MIDRPALLGLHHVTATVDDAQADLDFFEGTLGLRLVKKTVNFDNHNVYHFYYGDERGTPGTIWTTFPYRDQGVRAGTHGTRQITSTAFSVPAEALDFWRARLRAHGWDPHDLPSRFGEDVIRVTDPSGLIIELIGSERDARAPWVSRDVVRAAAIRGVHSVTLTVDAHGPTVEFLETQLGCRRVGEQGPDARVRVAIGRDLPGQVVDVVAAPEGPAGVNGLGTVHHVALAIATGEEQRRIRADLLRAGARVTEILDRQYFQSIYFREPGGVLFEIATAGPGFAIDEPVDRLGADLKLPPWEEPSRADIEAALPKVVR